MQLSPITAGADGRQDFARAEFGSGSNCHVFGEVRKFFAFSFLTWSKMLLKIGKIPKSFA